MQRQRIKVELIGKNGNAFNMLALCKRAANEFWSHEEWLKFQDEATSGDYNHLLATIQEYFDVS